MPEFMNYTRRLPGKNNSYSILPVLRLSLVRQAWSCSTFLSSGYDELRGREAEQIRRRDRGPAGEKALMQNISILYHAGKFFIILI
jgi:hypothetical protein